jgi:hypothetical protein
MGRPLRVGLSAAIPQIAFMGRTAGSVTSAGCPTRNLAGFPLLSLSRNALPHTIGLKSGLENSSYCEYFSQWSNKRQRSLQRCLRDGTCRLYAEQGNLLEEKSLDKGKVESDDN